MAKDERKTQKAQPGDRVIFQDIEVVLKVTKGSGRGIVNVQTGRISISGGQLVVFPGSTTSIQTLNDY